jgi:uridine kinase
MNEQHRPENSASREAPRVLGNQPDFENQVLGQELEDPDSVRSDRELQDQRQINQVRRELGLAEERGPQRLETFREGLDQLAERTRELLKGQDRALVVISGKTGSGKSELARQMRETLTKDGVEVALISTDDFYATRPDRPGERELDLAKLHETVTRLHRPGSVVLVEGLQAIDDQVVGEKPDLRAHVETDFGQRMGRRLVRDAKLGYRDVKTTLDMLTTAAVNNPDAILKFETSPNVDYVDLLVENDYREPEDPELAVRGNALVFSVGGQARELRQLTQAERAAVLKLGIQEIN